jgi:hypothetical protein
MQRLYSYRQGDRAEYLAHYILSALAITVPVPRQEDVGSDFHCSLLKRVGNNLHAYLPFNIQIKSDSPSLRRDGISFGGTTESGVWRRHEIDALCQTDMPFLVGVVNKEDQRLDLFSTISRYFVRVNWSGRGAPRRVDLLPYSPEGDAHLGNGDVIDLAEAAGMPSFEWRLPIGQPIVRISISDSENPERCEEIKGVLESYLRMDQENAVLTRLGIGHFNWPLVIRPNNQMHEVGIGWVFGPPGSPEFARQSQALVKIICSVLKSFMQAGMKEEIEAWLPVVARIDLASVDPVTAKVIEEARNFATK